MHITLNIFFLFSAIHQPDSLLKIYHISSEFNPPPPQINRNGLMHFFVSELLCPVAVSLFLPFLSLYLIHFSTFLKLNIFFFKKNPCYWCKRYLLWKVCLWILDVSSLPNTIKCNLLLLLWYVHIQATVRVLEQIVNTAFFFFFF